jgi:signal transduction histidine kinase/ligand-binding sensor domain-containing protein
VSSRGAALLLCLALLLLPSSISGRFNDDVPSQPSGLHLWGAVTLFHGLPSEMVRAVAQDGEGAMWFGTDAGLARYDGRRTQTWTANGLAGRRVSALRAAPGGALWVATDDGAFVRAQGAVSFQAIAETKGRRVTAIAAPASGRALLATADGYVFECAAGEGGRFSARTLGAQLTVAQGRSQPLELTSVAVAGDLVVVGTRGRGLMTIRPGGETEEIVTRPRVFFVESVEAGEGDSLLFGAQTSAGDSGLYKVALSRLTRPEKLSGAATGTITATALGPGAETYAATDGRGVFRFRAEGLPAERFTFAGTAGGLRSDRVNAVFVDREGVVWFGTDRGACRYDPHGVRVEQLSVEEDEANLVRALFRTSRGRLMAGTARGLYVREEAAPQWRAVEELRGKSIYSITEDARGRLLVGTASGLFVGTQTGTALVFGGDDATRAREGGKSSAAEAAPAKAQAATQADAAGAAEEKAEEKAKQQAEEKSGEKGAGETLTKEEKEAAERDADATERKSAEPLVGGSVRAVAVFGGATYLASFGRGLERLEGTRGRTLLWPREGDDWRGREVVSLFADETTGRLWVGTANAGVFRFDGRSIQAEPALAPLGYSTVWGAAASDGHLWLATSRGLFVLRPDGQLLEVAPGVDARAVLALAGAEGAPRAWCATAGSGVLRVALDARFGPITSRLDSEQGLPSQNAFALLAPPVEDGAGNADNNNKGDTNSAGNSGSGTFLIGTTRGVARYEAGRLAPTLHLSRVTASRAHQPEELTGGLLRLEYPQNSLVADVAASASRTFPEQFQYAFTLEDSRGRIVGQRLSHDSQFQAESLPAGRYIVTARAYSLDLVASAPLRFEFEVARAPLPLMTVALSVLLGLALVALVWGYAQHRRIVRGGEQLREANRQLAAARLQLANEAEAERRRIARDLHDQTLADLRRLLLMTDEMQRAGAVPAQTTGPTSNLATTVGATTVAVDPSVLRAEIEAVSQEIRRICEDLSPSVLENVGFAAALEWALASARAHLPVEEQFAYEFDCEENLEERLRLAPGVQMQVYRIVQEAVNNVCRHAGARRVWLSARIDEEGAFVLSLEDDGRGFDASNRKALKGRGLAGIRARAALIEAEVVWENRGEEQGGGTAFRMRKSGAAAPDAQGRT